MRDTTSTGGNPLLERKGIPAFDRIRPEHVVPGVRATLGEVAALLERLEAELEPSWDGLVKRLEELSFPLEYAWNPVQHFMLVKNSDELRKAHQEVLPEVVETHLRVKQSRPVYEGLVALREGDAWESLDEAQRRVVEIAIRDARHAGVGLTGESRERFVEIERELSKLGSDFQNHLLDATKAFELVVSDPADTKGWPESLRALAAQSYNQAHAEEAKNAGRPEATAERGPWRITLDFPSYRPFMEHSRRRDQREAVYRAMITRASGGEFDNNGIIERVLELRREKAELLGLPTYAELSLEEKMAPSVEAVEKMYDELFVACRPKAEQDLEDLATLAREGGQSEPLALWDTLFWAERLRERRFEYTEAELRPYFPMPKVLEGLFRLAERLFDVRILERKGAAPVWNEDVQYFEVLDREGKPVASFYLDAYSRPAEKQGGAWAGECFSRRRRIDGELITPVEFVNCNGTPPVGSKPSLMGFEEVKTLFHEFGHALQGMLTKVDYADVAGTNGIEWDAIEIASQFMENWCYHRPTLKGFSSHYETGEPLPDELFEKIVRAKTYRMGSLILRQMRFGKTDMALHHAYQPGGSGTARDVDRKVSESMSVLPLLPEDQFLCSFAHIFAGGYAAGYYSYLWSEVLSADAFAAFEEAGLEDAAAVRALGRKFRDTFLALGGGADPMEVFRRFRGREPSTAAFLRHNDLVES